LALTERGITVKIYRTNNNGHESFTVAWHGAGGRNRKRVATLAAAKREAQVAITAIANGHAKVLTLQDDDRLQYVAALKALEGTGIELKTAVEQFAHAHGLLGGCAEIAEAVRFYLKRHGTVEKKTVPVIVKEFLQERAQRSPKYLKDLKMRLERFSKDFPGLIGNVTTQEISKWLRDLKLGSRSRNPRLRTCGSLAASAPGRRNRNSARARRYAAVRPDSRRTSRIQPPLAASGSTLRSVHAAELITKHFRF
jgi:hypothetical protein